jgi:hypothetical protein
LLSVAPNSFTGMLTIPKLMEPLQIALAMRTPPRPPATTFSTRRVAYPQVYQHKLLINNDLQRSIISREGDGCCGMSHTDGNYRVVGFPFEAGALAFGRMTCGAELLVDSGWLDRAESSSASAVSTITPMPPKLGAP